MLAFLDIGFGELVIVGFVGLVLYGGRLPEMMRTLGTSYRKLKRSVDDLTRQATSPEPPKSPYRGEPPRSAEALPRPPAAASAVPAVEVPAPAAAVPSIAPVAPTPEAARPSVDEAPPV